MASSNALGSRVWIRRMVVGDSPQPSSGWDLRVRTPDCEAVVHLGEVVTGELLKGKAADARDDVGV
jgi:hypothetical protein